MLKPYEGYKSNNDELWLPAIPSHWHSSKMKYEFAEIIEKGHAKEPLLVSSQHMGVVPKSIYGLRTVEATKDLQLLKLVRVGDFVISLRSFQGGLEYAYYQGIISPAYTILRSHGKISNDYFRYLSKSTSFIALLKLCVTGIREGQNIDYSVLKNHYIPIPTRPEQDQIARFLDWKTSEMAHFIKEKKREIRRLNELKRAITNKAVTRGLHDNVPMKETGIEWLPRIPAHWDVRPLRQFLFPVSEKNHPDMPLLSVTREKGVIQRDVEDFDTNHNYIPDDLSGYKLVRKGQFVINKMKAWQGSYGVSEYDGIVSPAYFIFNLHFPNKKFFHFAIRSRIYVNFFAQFSDGIRTGQWDLSMQKMKQIPFFVPSEEEQEEILKVVPAKIAEIDAMITALNEEIALVQELRTKIIADVTTGKVDVRNVEIPQFEMETEELAGEEDADEESSEENDEITDEEVDE